jgi:hypothetical protein
MLTIIYLFLTYIVHLLDKCSNNLRNARYIHQDYNLLNSKIMRNEKGIHVFHYLVHNKIIVLDFF